MKYALAVSPQNVFATLFFDQTVNPQCPVANLYIGQSDRPGFPELFKSILGVKGLVSVMVRDNALMLEMISFETLFEPDCSWRRIGQKIASIIASERYELIEFASVRDILPSYRSWAESP